MLFISYEPLFGDELADTADRDPGRLLPVEFLRRSYMSSRRLVALHEQSRQTRARAWLDIIVYEPKAYCHLMWKRIQALPTFICKDGEGPKQAREG